MHLGDSERSKPCRKKNPKLKEVPASTSNWAICHWIPDRCVEKPDSSTSKLRVVFDGLVKSGGSPILRYWPIAGLKAN